MADVQVVLTLNDEQQAAIKLARDRIAPAVTNAELVSMIEQWAMEGIKVNLMAKTEALIDNEYRDVAAVEKAPIIAAIDANFPTP